MSLPKNCSCLAGKSSADIDANVVGIEDERGGSSCGKIGMSVEVERDAYDMSVVYAG